MPNGESTGGTPTVVELGLKRADRADVIAELRARRKPQVHLDGRFVPKGRTKQAPLMHYGLAMSKHDVLRCVHRLDIAPSVLDISEFDMDPSYDITQGRGYQREAQEHILIHLMKQSEIGRGAALGFGFKDCFVPEDKDCVLSLYTNYSRGNKKWSSSEWKRTAVEAKVAELLCTDGDPTTCLQWYWDANACGFGYCAPWDEFNIWSSAETPGWAREVHDLYPTRGQLCRKIPSDFSRYRPLVKT
ncbi:hypothetical protein PENSPDRAFT_750625 [Peniophora sp. CONT]|nr:hypothetical protein PENSPDRAFT_750625 [Peniophora sp. CONT]